MADSPPTLSRPGLQTPSPFWQALAGWWKGLLHSPSVWLRSLGSDGLNEETAKYKVDCVEAVYWDGSARCTHPIREIGLEGALIDTSLDWCEKTLLRVSIRSLSGDVDPAEAKVLPDIWCQVVGRVAGHLHVEFVFKSVSERNDFLTFLSEVVVSESGKHLTNRR